MSGKENLVIKLTNVAALADLALVQDQPVEIEMVAYTVKSIAFKTPKQDDILLYPVQEEDHLRGMTLDTGKYSLTLNDKNVVELKKTVSKRGRPAGQGSGARSSIRPTAILDPRNM